MDVYIDDMVVKRKKEPDHLKDLVEVFTIVKEYKLRLNATKCAFIVSSGKFLGHLVTQWEIEANLEHISAIITLSSGGQRKRFKNWLEWQQHFIILSMSSIFLTHLQEYNVFLE